MTTEKPRRASREELQELHTLLTDVFLQWMRGADRHQMKAFQLEVLRKFLRDNGVAKNLTSATDIQSSLADLGSLDVPFLPTLAT